MKRFLVLSLIAISVLFGMQAWAAPKTPASRKPAPATRVETLDGKNWELATHKGKVVIIDFWATWCPPCREEIPHFKALYAKYPSRVEIIGIALDQDGPGVVEQFAKQHSINYPLAMGNDQRLASAYGGIRGIPTTFVIDKKGQIYKKYVGYQDQAVFEKDIAALLKEP